MYKAYLKEKQDFGIGTWIGVLCGIMAITGIIGFFYEVIFYWANSEFHTMYWRGSTFGPWIDVYCIGSLIMFGVLYRFRSKPWLVLIIGTVGGSLVELLLGVCMYYFFNGARGWNYNLEILNAGSIGGFICIRSIIVMAALSMLIIYVVAPLVIKIAQSMSTSLFITFYYIIGAVCLCDILYNNVLVNVIPQFKSAYDIYSQLGMHYMSF